ncbi:hypothetical protein PT974_01159 [Cladobotryum mycophilum]|uniref:RNAse P Rpr2/Rpp21 subunit domain-containing protein n=1 Tax=Cladobotryum mycophilum TaxID=491253 RepID=A0ABR0T4C1_9HYPO
MAKAKGPASVQNRHIYTRASYLYQAANYLANCAQASSTPNHGPSRQEEAANKAAHSALTANEAERKALMNVSRQVISDMRSVSLKMQIRSSPTIKSTICKFCDTLQIEGKTCRSAVENASKGGRKPWADVLVIRCDTCGHAKRYPISGVPRQKRRSMRVTEAAENGVSREDDTSASKQTT